MRKPRPLWLQRLMFSRFIVAILILAQIFFIVATIIHYQRLQWLNTLMTAISFLIALHLLTRREDNIAFKLSLVFIILLFPLFGGALYCILQFQTTNLGFRNRLAKIENETKEEYQCSEEALLTAMSLHPESRKQMYYLQSDAKFPVCRNTDTVYFPNGKEMMDSLISELQRAKKYIFIEFFIIEEGVFWNSIMEILKERAANGVDVRIIYDDIGSLLRLPKKYTKQLQAYGIQCVVFNPFRPFLTSIQNNRDHRKIIVIDGEVAYTGGINLADEYIGEKVLYGKWKDNAILLRGNGAWSFAVMFLQMWSFLTKKKESISAYAPASFPTATEKGWVQPYCDSPMDKEHVGEQVYLGIIEQAKHYLYITTPYLTIDGNVLAALKLAAKSGVDVRIITPGIPDKRIVHFTSRSYYRELLQAGVRIFEYTDGFIHSKSFLADDRVATVGTINLDFRSLYLHFECGTCLYQTDTLNEIKKDYLQALTECREVLPSDCKTNLFVRILQDILRVFAPLM